MKIWFRTHALHQCSWTIVWNYLRRAFAEIGADLHIGPYAPDGDYVELWWGNPAEWEWEPTGLRVGMALSEARSLQAEGREKAIENLKRCHLLICPSHAASLAFYELPLACPIEVAHFGVDPEEMLFVDRDFKGRLRFLVAGAAQYRKGTNIAIEAFIQAFRWRHNVELVVWSSVKTPMRERLKEEYKGVRSITFDDSVLESSFEMYRKCHVLVSPHLSEGFALQPLEAMATGMPCLMARCSAPMEYFGDDFGYWIEMSENYVPVSDCLKDTGGVWRLPSVESLAEQMRYVYRNRQEAKAKGEAAARHVVSNFQWVHTAHGICDAMEEYFGESFIGSDASTQRSEAAATMPEAAGGSG